jgi:hypothetical protein
MGQTADKGLVLVGFRPTPPVVEMCHDQAAGARVVQARQCAEEGHAVAATGNRNHDRHVSPLVGRPSCRDALFEPVPVGHTG